MKFVTTPKDTKIIDTRTYDEYGIPTLLLMERAALETYILCASLVSYEDRITIVCGNGNNAGDGFALARILHQKGYRVSVVILSNEDRYNGDCLINYNIIKKMNIEITQFVDKIDRCDFLIDAIFGTGLDRDIEGKYKKAIIEINNCSSPVLSIDMPSGINGLDGSIMGVAIKANYTISFQTYKRGQLLFPGRDYCGETHIRDIGIPKKILANTKEFVIDDEYIIQHNIKRTSNSHKGTYGHALIIAGSNKYQGAGLLSITSCIKSGVGLATWANPFGRIVDTPFEAIVIKINDEDGFISKCGADEIITLLNGKKAIGVGMGLGIDAGKRVMDVLVKNSNLPMVIDADALNAIALYDGKIKFDENVVMTPHPKEASRLLGVDVNVVAGNPIESALDIAEKYNCICVLKMATTIIANSNGNIAYNTSGNAGMAKGGSGDVLSGIITAMLAKGHNGFTAACIGVYNHGKAADICAKELGLEYMTPSDVIENLKNL